jgi:Ni/Co efflux regulator RcnB
MRIVILGVLLLTTAPAGLAQTFTPPRFPALEQQQLRTEQQRIDDLERGKVQADLFGGQVAGDAGAALRRLEINREIDEVRLEGDQLRAQSVRERTLATAALPNRRIARASVLTVQDPAAAGLPAAPRGQYYARLEGRHVLVDAASELVVEVLPSTPFGPDDAPAGPPSAPGMPVPEAGRP